jgi:hypothetical protein
MLPRKLFKQEQLHQNQYKEHKATLGAHNQGSGTTNGTHKYTKKSYNIYIHKGSIKDGIILINTYYTLQKWPQYKR